MWLLILILAVTMADPKNTGVSRRAMEIRYEYGMLASQVLIPFCRLTSPDPMAPADIRQSQFQVARHFRYVADHLECLERGDIKRLGVVLPRRHGKTTLAVKKFVPWFCGRHPERSVIVGTYSDRFAEEHGRAVRDVFLSPGYRQAFPSKNCQLRMDSQSAARLQLEGGGVLTFVGRGGAITGKGADLFILDDVFKDAEEARSELVRQNIWEWFHTVVNNSFNTVDGLLLLIGTRWNEDDLTGRLTDPKNQHYSPEEAQRWRLIRLPALAEDSDPLGRKRDEALWPDRLPAEIYLAKRAHPDPTVRSSFTAMDQGRPTPEEGDYFRKGWLKTYAPNQLPQRLRMYCASDHAFRAKRINDLQCLIPFGVDETGIIWVLPDVFWDRCTTDKLAQEMIDMMRRHKPLMWYAAQDAISGSIGPFLRRMMREQGVYVAIDEVREGVDLVQRAQGIRGRASMGLVMFPGFAPWWGDALSQLLAFPNDKHDDFVAALALVGMALDRLVEAEGVKHWHDPRPKPGTLEWVKWSSKEQQRFAMLEKNKEGF